MPVDIILKKEIPSKPSILVGFPSTGLVGSIALAYLIEKNKFELVGYIVSSDFAPLATIHNYNPLPPVRIYYSKDKNLLAILSEIAIPIGLSHELAEKIFKLAKELEAKQIISLGGISLKENENAIYLVGNKREEVEKYVEKKIGKSIREGATTGIIGSLLSLGEIYNFNTLAILAEANTEYADPRAALNALHALGKIFSLRIDTSELEREAKVFASKEKEAYIKSKVLSKTSDNKMYG